MPNITRFFQHGILVNDLDEAIERWLRSARVGPFYVMRHVQVADFLYRGQPATIDFSTALAQAGPLQIELIQQHSAGPSAYRDTFAPGQEGFHHLCTFVEDFDAEVAHHAAHGSVMAAEGAFGDMRFGYLDTRTQIGCMTEIIEDRASIRALFKLVADAAEGWDGRDPVRTP